MKNVLGKVLILFLFNEEKKHKHKLWVYVWVAAIKILAQTIIFITEF